MHLSCGYPERLSRYHLYSSSYMEGRREGVLRGVAPPPLQRF